MNKLEVLITPITNNSKYIISKMNLAMSGDFDIIFYISDFKIETNNRMKSVNLYQKSKTVLDDWNAMLLNIEFDNYEMLAKYICNFCEKTYKQGGK